MDSPSCTLPIQQNPMPPYLFGRKWTENPLLRPWQPNQASDSRDLRRSEAPHLHQARLLVGLAVLAHQQAGITSVKDVWYDMIWYDMIWYDMMWYDMIWYDVMWYVSHGLSFWRDSFLSHLSVDSGARVVSPSSLSEPSCVIEECVEFVFKKKRVYICKKNEWIINSKIYSS